jgi:hypothetical protein
VDTVHVRMMENLTPQEVADIGSLASCECGNTSRFIINMVMPSFCSSTCINEVTCRLGTATQPHVIIINSLLEEALTLHTRTHT